MKSSYNPVAEQVLLISAQLLNFELGAKLEDRCVYGRRHEIHTYSLGEYWAKASPSWFLRLCEIDEPSSAPALAPAIDAYKSYSAHQNS